jgi:hypothetical protein
MTRAETQHRRWDMACWRTARDEKRIEMNPGLAARKTEESVTPTAVSQRESRRDRTLPGRALRETCCNSAARNPGRSYASRAMARPQTRRTGDKPRKVIEKPRYGRHRRRRGGTLSEKRGSGGVRSEKGNGSSGVPVTGGARIRWRNRLAGGKLQRKNQGSIFSAGVDEENANERRSAGRASAAARNKRQKNNETLVPYGTQENKRRRKP